ncbi:MAG: succinate dehydrogenase [Chloroflexota bacterium]|nr:succinate dehydrogenase [Chloroflexota bacterium]
MRVSPRSSGRVKPSGGGTEVAIWYLMRVTGVLLFVMALAHFSIMHFIWDPAEQTAEFVTRERWSNLFWRAYDWTLLMLVLFHSFVGMRTVILDYIHNVRARVVIMSAMWILAGILFVIGTLVVVTLPGLEI